MTYIVTVKPKDGDVDTYLVESENTTKAKLDVLRRFWQKNSGAHVESCEARRGQGANK